MRVLVVGGSGSGKSAYAERLAARLAEQRTYVATMRNEGTEADERIRRHREQRADLGFVTIECPDSLAAACREKAEGVVLVDDLGNLVANALFAPDGTMADPATVLDRLAGEVEALAQSYEQAVLVGNEVGSEGVYRFEGTNVWVRLIGALNCRIAASFDEVVEVVAGVPCHVKGDAA